MELVYHCDEIFMCTTAGGIMPITQMDGQPVNDGKVGPVTKIIWDEYWRMRWEDQYSFKIEYDGGAEQIDGRAGDGPKVNGH